MNEEELFSLAQFRDWMIIRTVQRTEEEFGMAVDDVFVELVRVYTDSMLEDFKKFIEGKSSAASNV